MPAEIEIDVERGLVTTICAGTVTDEEFIAARKRVLADPRFELGFDRLWDFSAVTEEQVSAGTIVQLVETAPFSGEIARAVVVSMVPQALARVMDFVDQSRRLNRRIAAFPTREAAEQWIESERVRQSTGEADFSGETLDLE
ncbi:MAG: hypothetical protein ABIR71_05270 [Chthoniobacterales bacterium]